MALEIGSVPVPPPATEGMVIEADICVVGAGAAGLSAALESAALGKRVVLADSLPTIGGQAVHGLLNTLCGFYSNGPAPHRVVYGIADPMIAFLRDNGAAHWRPARNSVIIQYDETAMARWAEGAVLDAGIEPLMGAILLSVERDGGRLRSARFATRWGEVTVRAAGWVDASGDAALTWHAGFPLHQADQPIYGTQMVTIEGLDETALARLTRRDVEERLIARADDFGLTRRDGFVFAFPGQGVAVANMTHVAVPTDAIGQARATLEGRDQADLVLRFLKAEFADAFAHARIRAYGQLGIRQTRCIEAVRRITTAEIRAGHRFDDAIGRCTWPIELHQRHSVHWEEFGDEHVNTVPFSALVPREADNLVAAGRCIDAEPLALAAVRVIGPCIAMGAAAAHALDLAGAGSVRQIDTKALQARIADNLSRTDTDPEVAGAVAPRHPSRTGTV